VNGSSSRRLFFNAESLAETRFDSIETAYRRYAALARELPASLRPTVFGGALWRGIWYVAGGKSYPAQLVRDAGGAYLWADDTSRGSLPLDFEAVYDRAHNAKVWLAMRNEWKTLADIESDDGSYAGFAAYGAGEVFNANARLNRHGGNDYWESGMLEPHILLADLIKILHPELLPEHRLKFYQRLK
jgi:iron complex transport system substrate-binding protein